jgi:hypothetical protein
MFYNFDSFLVAYRAGEIGPANDFLMLFLVEARN